MKLNLFILYTLSVALAFQACDDDEPSPDDGDLITRQDVESVFNALPPDGYESTFYIDNLPASLQAGYTNTVTTQNIAVAASENLTGEVINVTDAVVESNFIAPDAIQQRTVNSIDVYQAMDQSTYRVVMFLGQYRFDILVQNDPDPTEAEAEAELFIQLMTDVMSSF